MTPDHHSLDWQNLVQENGALRAIITDLLIANQELRWQLLGYHKELGTGEAVS